MIVFVAKPYYVYLNFSKIAPLFMTSQYELIAYSFVATFALKYPIKIIKLQLQSFNFHKVVSSGS